MSEVAEDQVLLVLKIAMPFAILVAPKLRFPNTNGMLVEENTAEQSRQGWNQNQPVALRALMMVGWSESMST